MNAAELATAAVLLVDIVDSSELSARLGDAAMAPLWAAHDRIARDLLAQWRGQEIDKTDGFLLLFEQAADAAAYALAYHRALARLEPPLRARAGLHVGPVSLRENPPADVARGAKPLELDGLSKPTAARVMSVAGPGQTLLTAAAREALGQTALRLVSHGHWRAKGLAEPLELFELGDDESPLRPPPDAEKVYRVVRQGELWLPVREVRHNLPAQRDAFVGRRHTLQELAQRFEAGARLVSLLGMGGSGKTRLATHFGWAWLGDFPGGVWFCDLANARTLDGVLSAVAQGLDVPLGKEGAVAQLGHAIAGRGACLVIFDNFEQVARHAEETVGQWLERAADARFLVTSREVLGIAGEEALALAPMTAADAQALFMKRAAAAQRGFTPTAEDQAAIGPLVKLLDGLPLAIELAAARVRSLPPRALLARMSERFKLLASTGSRLDRQATLRAAFDWSWDLLSLPDKAALAQLAVFEGGFTLEAAEGVLDLSAYDGAPWIVDAVISLVDKSFVRPLADERFELLMSVQAYALEHLQTADRYPGSGPQALRAACHRHHRWFAALGPDRAVAHACAELDNLAAACRHAVADGDSASACGALEGAWAATSHHGPYQGGLALCELVCGMPGLQGRELALAQYLRARAASSCGQQADAGQALTLAMAAAHQAGDTFRQTLIHIDQAELHLRGGNVASCQIDIDQALALARSANEPLLECMALNTLGSLQLDLGHTLHALAAYEQGLALARQQASLRWQGNLLGNLGNVYSDIGRMVEALAHCEQALDIARRIGDRRLEGNTLCNLGMMNFVLGQLDAAGSAGEAALQVAREIGHVQLECIVLCNLGLVYDVWGRRAQAMLSFNAAITSARRIGDRRSEGQFLGYLGLALARESRFDPAREHLSRGQAILRDFNDQRGLGVLLCAGAECEWLAGEAAPARAALQEAAALAEQIGAGPASELGLAVARVRSLIAGVAAAA